MFVEKQLHVHPFFCTEGGSLYTWPPITGAGSKCQNMGSGHESKKTHAAEDACHLRFGTRSTTTKGQITSTIERFSTLLSFTSLFHKLSVLLVSCGISSMHLLILSRLSFLWNNTSRIPVNMRAPASSAATAVHACNDAYCDPLVPVNTFDHDSTSTPTVLFLKKYRPNNHVPLSSILFYPLSMVICLCPSVPRLARWSTC